MKFQVFKSKQFAGGKTWLLAELNLYEYVNSLTEENFNFEVQRKIVKNRWLDGILSTIEAGEPLPSITLSYGKKLDSDSGNHILDLDNEHLDILDGLQRTYRLWAFWKIYTTLKDVKFHNLKNSIKLIKEEYPDFFEYGIVDTKFFRKYFPDGKPIIDFEEKYRDFEMFFTIWVDLSERELVQKMLILNAGHKAVSNQHQFEILFLNLWKSLKPKLNGLKVAREKDSDFNRIKRGHRLPGEYLFSTIITSLMSLVLAKPTRISSDIIYKYDLIGDNEEGSSLQYAELLFNSDFIADLLQKLKRIDLAIDKQKGAVLWFGKDTTLNGVFAGIGVILNLNKAEYVNGLDEKILDCFATLEIELASDLELENFNAQYDKVTGRSANIGNLIRGVIMNYTIKKLQGDSPKWSSLFNNQESPRL